MAEKKPTLHDRVDNLQWQINSICAHNAAWRSALHDRQCEMDSRLRKFEDRRADRLSLIGALAIGVGAVLALFGAVAVVNVICGG